MWSAAATDELRRIICSGSDGVFLPAETTQNSVSEACSHCSVDLNPLYLMMMMMMMMMMMTTVIIGVRCIVAF